jgi:hypothetical protein
MSGSSSTTEYCGYTLAAAARLVLLVFSAADSSCANTRLYILP